MSNLLRIITIAVTTLKGSSIKPLFISVVHSRYDDEKVVWRENLTQEDALGFALDYHEEAECEIMEDVQCTLMNNPVGDIVLPTNPCHFGLVFGGFQKGKSDISIGLH